MQKYRTHGKWILAGEHSVLRGGEALVFPVESRYLDFSFEPGDKLVLNLAASQKDLELAFWGVLEKALQKLNLSRDQVSGIITLSSNIPVGAGMGASATLCVSLARWLCDLGFLNSEECYEFAKDLENLFHGESSGVDVAVALKHTGLIFSRDKGFEEFIPKWKPNFYLSYCGKRGVTADCIERVQKLLKSDPKLGQSIDQQMKTAVALAQEALLSQNHIKLLKESIDLAKKAFQDWGLISRDLEGHMDLLKKAGALATKPTGSGEGGFVLSLWSSGENPSLSEIELIKA